jgi:hypothetical protein
MYELLRAALRPSKEPVVLSKTLSEDEWNAVHAKCIKQDQVGIAYRAICRLNKDQLPPRMLLFQWTQEAESIKGHNELLNAKAAYLTELFAKHGRKTAVLKGPANARLYPDAFMRQAGDIDLWVDGGRESVVALMKKLGMEFDDKDLSQHHAHLHEDENGVVVEIHYKVVPDLANPFASRRMQKFLETEIRKAERVPEGFCVPSIKFALVMQLSHIQKHVFLGGIGLKQMLDYYILLQNSTEKDRREVKQILSNLGFMGTCAALMWILEHVLGLEKSLMLCKPKERFGRKVLAEIDKGGHFGFFKRKDVTPRAHAIKWLKCRLRIFELFGLSPSEKIWREIGYWKDFAKTVPRRLKERRLYLSKKD